VRISHPDVFSRDENVREFLGVDPDEPYVIVRFNALDALHDADLEGFSSHQRRDLLERLSEHATVFVSDEGGEMDLHDSPARPYDLHPALIHDAMADASLLIADTGTMATEAALLGTPAFRYRGTDTHEYGEFRNSSVPASPSSSTSTPRFGIAHSRSLPTTTHRLAGSDDGRRTSRGW